MKKHGGAAGPQEGVQVVVQNRKARHDFQIEDRIEAGLALTGSEVKSLRAGNVALADAYAMVKGDELILVSCRIGEYQPASYTGHAPLRERRLLLHRAEIEKLRGKVERARHLLGHVFRIASTAGRGRGLRSASCSNRTSSSQGKCCTSVSGVR